MQHVVFEFRKLSKCLRKFRKYYIKTEKWKKMARLKEINNVKTYHTVWCCFRRPRPSFLHCICKYPYPICENSSPLKSSLSQIATEFPFVFHIFHSIRAFHLDSRCRDFTYKLYSKLMIRADIEIGEGTAKGTTHCYFS